jgi:DNA-binding CsgD family transcriptional regulator
LHGTDNQPMFFKPFWISPNTKPMKIKPEDFILKQNILREDIDYKVAEGLLKHTKSMESLLDKCFTIFDYYRNEFYYISPNTPFFSVTGSLQKQSYQFLIENSDNEDIVLMHNIQQRAFKFLQKTEVHERSNYVFSVYVRMICQGKKVETIYRVKAEVLDKKGNIWLSLAVLDKTDKYIRPQVIHILTGEKHFFKPMPLSEFKSYTHKLSKKELLVLNLMAEGLNSIESCEKLQIKTPTYKRHRSGIYRKLGTDSKLSALNRAFVYGIIK